MEKEQRKRLRQAAPKKKTGKKVPPAVVGALCALGAIIGYIIPIGDEAPPARDKHAAQPETPAPEPETPDFPTPEPEPEPEPMPEPEPTPAEPEPEPEPTPAEPEPEPEPTPAEPDDQPEPQPVPDRTPEQDHEAKGPYSGTVSLVGNALELQKEWRELMDRLADERDVAVFVHDIDVRIRDDVKQLFTGKTFNVAKFRSSACLLQAVEICSLARGMGAENLQKLITPPGEDDGKSSGLAFWQWCLRDKTRPLHTFMTNFKLNAGRTENFSYAFNMFFELWKRTPERDRAKYLNLALACSLVSKAYAQSPTQVRHAKPEEVLTMVQVYDYFREMDSKRRLLTDIKKLSVSDLLYVVNVRLPRSEFDWVHKEMKFKRENWGASYESVPYVMERATQGKDLYEDYTFKEILKEGGVCRDRGYYAANTARCMGIPAVYITGDGARGGHAWIAWMVSDKEWRGAGSYGYDTGRFQNPCSGFSMHEFVLLKRDRRNADPNKMELVANLLGLSEYLERLECVQESLGASEMACSQFPYLTASWVCRLDIMKRIHDKEPLEKAIWKRVQSELMRHASKNSELVDLAQEVQNDFVLADSSSATKKAMLRSTARKLEKSVGGSRPELILDSLALQAQVYLDANDYRGLGQFYRQQYKKYAANGRSDIFASVMGQHIKMLEKVDDKKLWKSLAKDAESIFGKNAYKNGDYFKIQKDAGVMKIIADLYRRAGDDRKADRIEAESEKIVAESARKAEGN